MIEDTISHIEARLKSASGLNDGQRAELESLLVRLKSELAALAKVDADQAQTVAGYVEISAHEATRAKRNPQSVHHALEGLTQAVAGLEARHPQLTEWVNSFTVLLSNTGI